MIRFGILQRQHNNNGRHKTVSGKTETESQFVSDSIEGHYRFAAVASDAGPPCARIGTEKRSAYTIIAREMAPGDANETMFVGRSSTEGGFAVGIPGQVRGLWLAHQIGGKLPWKDLFQPSIKLCREGIVVRNPVAFAMSRQTETIKKFQGLKDLVVNPETGRFYEAGDTVKRPKLARTLEIIANEGVDAFYNGRLSKDIVADIQDAGGVISEDDLAGYTALRKKSCGS